MKRKKNDNEWKNVLGSYDNTCGQCINIGFGIIKKRKNVQKNGEPRRVCFAYPERGSGIWYRSIYGSKTTRGVEDPNIL